MQAPNISKLEAMLAGVPLPESTKQTIQIDLRDAIDRGFHVDYEQLGTNLARLSVPTHRVEGN